MYQLVTLIVTDWILPNSAKDTPLRWTVRAALITAVAWILAR